MYTAYMGWDENELDLTPVKLTCLCGFPAGLFDVLLNLCAEFDLQLLSLYLQVLLPLCKRSTRLQEQHADKRRVLFMLVPECSISLVRLPLTA